MILVLFGALLEDAKKFATHLTPVISCVRSPSIISLARWKMENVYMYINKIIRTPRESRITSLVASRKGQYEWLNYGWENPLRRLHQRS